MDKNLPASAGDMGFRPWSGKIPHVSKLVHCNYRACALESMSCSPGAYSLCSATSEATAMRKAHVLQLEDSPRLPQLEKKPACSNKGPAQPKIKYLSF